MRPRDKGKLMEVQSKKSQIADGQNMDLAEQEFLWLSL